MKRTAISEWAGAAGMMLAEEGGWQVVQTSRGAATALSLSDQSARGKLFIKGAAAEGVITAVFQTPTLAVNQGAVIPEGVVCRLRRDLFFVHTAAAGETAVQTRLNEAIEAQAVFVTVTDSTHGRFQFQLSGSQSAELLSRVCGLDFHEAHFPHLAAKQSSVAKTAQLIIRQDVEGMPGYYLIGARSLAVYVWQTLLQAGRDLGITPFMNPLAQAATNKS